MPRINICPYFMAAALRRLTRQAARLTRLRSNQDNFQDDFLNESSIFEACQPRRTNSIYLNFNLKKKLEFSSKENRK